MMMENNGVLVTVILKCTGNRIAHFHVPRLSDVPYIGDRVGLADMIESESFSASVMGREVHYLLEEGGACQVYSILLTVVFSFEKWLYRWQEIVDTHRNRSDTTRAFRKSDKFLTLYADIHAVGFIVDHHDAFGIDSFGVSLLDHYIIESRREQQMLLDEQVKE